MTRMLDPWERQPYDGDEDWPLFVLYRDQAPPRQGLSLLVNGRRVDPIMVSRWMRAHFWRERAAEYDRHLDDIRREEIESVVRQSAAEVKNDHMRMLYELRQVALREVEKLREQVANPFTILKPRELTAVFETIMKYDRLIRGESTENIQTPMDLSNFSDRDLDAMEEILNRNVSVPTSH